MMNLYLRSNLSDVRPMRYGFISRYVEFEGDDLVNILAAKHLLIIN